MHTPGSKNITEKNNAVMKQEFVNREAWQDYSHLLSLGLALQLRWLSVFLIASCRFYVQLVTNQAALHVLSEPLDYTRENQLQLLFLARKKAGKARAPKTKEDQNTKTRLYIWFFSLMYWRKKGLQLAGLAILQLQMYSLGFTSITQLLQPRNHSTYLSRAAMLCISWDVSHCIYSPNLLILT